MNIYSDPSISWGALGLFALLSRPENNGKDITPSMFVHRGSVEAAIEELLQAGYVYHYTINNLTTWFVSDEPISAAGKQVCQARAELSNYYEGRRS